jgi:glycosyltransferase involved in cell wall biosynthesis
VAWERFQARTSVLGPALGGEACHIRGSWPSRHVVFLPLRYLADAARMWRLLRQRRPSMLVVITPPIVAPLLGWLWCLGHDSRLVIDAHTGALHSWKWRWAVPAHRFLFRRASAVSVHTEEDEAQVREWGAPALLLPDDLPDRAAAAVSQEPAGVTKVVVAGSFDGNEPVAEAVAAAALIPEVEVHLTGDTSRLAPSVRPGAPANAVFTGFLAYPQYLAELLTADVVAVFSDDPHIMNRAAFEAIGLGRPLVLSDLPGLRGRFGDAARFCPNEPAAMAECIRAALRDRAELAQRSAQLDRRLRAQREAALAQLGVMVQTSRHPNPPPQAGKGTKALPSPREGGN